jgi:RNA polymerase sigma-70 factor (ECF subfamily)
MASRHERFPTRDCGIDEQAMRAVQLRGDQAAFAELVYRWESPIRRLCARMTCDEHRGEDLAQEVFARVFTKRDQFDPLRKFSTWLWRIALNACLAESRRTVHLVVADEGATATAPCDRELLPDERVVAQECVEQVKMALSRLPDAYRAVVVLREYEGMKYREIAEVLEIPEGTVKWRMAEALSQLGRELQFLASDQVVGRVPASRPPR